MCFCFVCVRRCNAAMGCDVFVLLDCCVGCLLRIVLFLFALPGCACYVLVCGLLVLLCWLLCGLVLVVALTAFCLLGLRGFWLGLWVTCL